MKKKLFLILICCVMSMSVFAEDYTDANNVTWKVTLNESTKEATIEQGVAGNTKDVVVPGTITIGEQNYIVTAIGYCAFATREDIETISLPATITTIANGGYTTINDSYTTYGVFSRNKNLKSVDFNGASCTIGDYAFDNCSSLSSVVDLSQCTSIGYEAFRNCSALTSVGNLSQCKSIGESAFSGCSALNKIVLSSETMATLGSTIGEHTSVLVPESLLENYKAADNWKDMAYRILSIGTTTEYDVEVVASDNSSALQTKIGEENLANVIALKVKGSINGYDVMILRNKMVNLHSLDLSEANIVEDANHYCYYGSYYNSDADKENENAALNKNIY